jgi:hypothetical protein
MALAWRCLCGRAGWHAHTDTAWADAPRHAAGSRRQAWIRSAAGPPARRRATRAGNLRESTISVFVRRLRQGLGAAAGLALVAGITVALAAPGAHPLVLQAASGGVWLPWDTTGTVTHLESTTGRADAAITVPGAAGHRLAVLTDGPDLLVVDRTSGLLHLVQPQRLAPARSAALPVGSVVTTAHGAVYVADASTGRVRRLDGRRLLPIGPAIDLGGPLGAIAQSGDGTLWLPVRSSGTVVAVRAGHPSAPVRVAPAGHAIDVILAAGQPVIIDATAGSLTPLAGDRTGRALVLPRGSTAGTSDANSGTPGPDADADAKRLIAAAEVPGHTIPVVDGGAGRLLLADLPTGRVRGVDLPPAAGWGAGGPAGPTPARTGGAHPRSGGGSGPTGLPDIDRPAGTTPGSSPTTRATAPSATPTTERPVWHDGQIYVPGRRQPGTAWVLDTRTLQFTAPVTAPVTAASTPPDGDGGPTVTASGAQVWVNDPNGPNLVLIDGERRTVLSKQTAGLAGQSGSAPPRPLPPPPPRPSETPVPSPSAAPAGTDQARRRSSMPTTDTAVIPRTDQTVSPPPPPTTPTGSPPPQPTATPSTPPTTPHPEPTPDGLPGPVVSSTAQAPRRN